MQNRSRSRSSSQGSYNGGRDAGNFVEPNKKLFIGGISPQMNPDELRLMFEKIGSVEDFFVKRAEEGKDYTFGFVTMSSLEEAEQAISALSGKRVADKMILVKYSKPKSNDRNERNGGGRPPQNRDRPFGGRNQGDREERPQWNQGNRREERGDKGDWGNRGDQGNRGGDRRQGFGQQNQYDQGRRNFGGHQDNGYQKREGQQRRENNGFEGGRGQGGFQKNEVQSKPQMVIEKQNEDFDY